MNRKGKLGIAAGAIIITAAIGSAISGNHTVVSAKPVAAPVSHSQPAPDYTPAANAPAAPAAPQPSMAQQQALTSAQGYLSDGQGFSKTGLFKQLTSSYGDGFHPADARWAIRHLHPDWKAQAVISAKGYLHDGQGFSRAGLIGQLTSSYGDGFTLAQATYAVNQAGL
jgi:hypothetical protein